MTKRNHEGSELVVGTTMIVGLHNLHLRRLNNKINEKWQCPSLVISFKRFSQSKIAIKIDLFD